ncbi:hypothetical protein F4802DRAFT_289007 [Xylaria palmicola]|nr:hypothetical protein F4802DRAFT_289007 [Xylaria palmicola]
MAGPSAHWPAASRRITGAVCAVANNSRSHDGATRRAAGLEQKWPWMCRHVWPVHRQFGSGRCEWPSARWREQTSVTPLARPSHRGVVRGLLVGGRILGRPAGSFWRPRAVVFFFFFGVRPAREWLDPAQGGIHKASPSGHSSNPPSTRAFAAALSLYLVPCVPSRQNVKLELAHSAEQGPGNLTAKPPHQSA